MLRGDTLKGTVVLVAIFSFLVWRFQWRPLAKWQHNLLTVNTNYTQVDAIVVLGYSVDHVNAIATPPLASRLEKAFHLLCHERVGEVVVMTGGYAGGRDPNVPTEAQVMTNWMTKRWNGEELPQARNCPTISSEGQKCELHFPKILIEDQSTSTFTNALYSLRLLQKDHPNIKKLLLITNPFHQWRTYKTWEKVIQSDEFVEHKFEIEMAEMKNDRAEEKSTQFDFWREMLAIAWYFVNGYI